MPAELVSRDVERQRIDTFWRTHVEEKRPGSLYISGKPGTGKTGTLSQLLRSYAAEKDQTPTVCVNCMSVAEPKQIFVRILEELTTTKYPNMRPNEALERLDELFCGPNKLPAVVLVVDEIDQLATRDNSVLYRLFCWPQQPNSSVILLSIANALDLTERILPLLRRWNCNPETLLFEPYTRDQIVDIVQSRLQAVEDGGSVLDLPAIKLCAAKVTSFSGDARQALDLCRRTLELAQSRKEPHIKIMASLFREVLGSDQVQRIRGLPLHQKLLLIALMRRGRSLTEVDARKVAEEYHQICKAQSLDPIQNNMMDVLMHLDCGGYITVTLPRGKQMDRGSSKVKLMMRPDDILSAFEGHPIFGPMVA